MDSNEVDDYTRSKTLAEKAAWDFVQNITSGNKFALTTINPTFVVGPLLIDEQGASISVSFLRYKNKQKIGYTSLSCWTIRDAGCAAFEFGLCRRERCSSCPH